MKVQSSKVCVPRHLKVVSHEVLTNVFVEVVLNKPKSKQALIVISGISEIRLECNL